MSLGVSLGSAKPPGYPSSTRTSSATSEWEGSVWQEGRELPGHGTNRWTDVLCPKSRGSGGVCSRVGAVVAGTLVVCGQWEACWCPEVAEGRGRFRGLAVVAWTLVVCGQWVTCCV